MACNIRIYDCPLDIKDHEDAKIYHKSTLDIGEDERYNLSEEKSNISVWISASQSKHSIVTKLLWYRHKNLKWRSIIWFARLSSGLNQYIFFKMVSVQKNNKLIIGTSDNGLDHKPINIPIKCAYST